MAGKLHCVFNFGHTLPMSFFSPPPLFCAEAKKSNITHRKSNYFAFRPDKRFKGKESPSATSLCLHLRCIRAVTQLKLGSA